jgi:hypothetical protein
MHVDGFPTRDEMDRHPSLTIGPVEETREATQNEIEEAILNGQLNTLAAVSQGKWHAKDRVMRKLPPRHPDKHAFEKDLSAVLALCSPKYNEPISARSASGIERELFKLETDVISGLRALVTKYTHRQADMSNEDAIRKLVVELGSCAAPASAHRSPESGPHAAQQPSPEVSQLDSSFFRPQLLAAASHSVFAPADRVCTPTLFKMLCVLQHRLLSCVFCSVD